ncbi:MAG: thioredoxin domain-containing protein [Chromatiales bacterium]|nr:thioredoxin domain-containing protein [Chromatiales bacterium]
MRRVLCAGLCLFSLGVGVSYANDAPLFRLNGLDYSAEDLSMPLQQAIFELQSQYYRQLGELVNGAALDTYVSEKAEKENLPRELILAKELSADPPSEVDVKKFYEDNKDKIKLPFNQVARQIALEMQRQTVQHKALALVNELRRTGVYQPLIKAPAAPLVTLNADGYPRRGATDAKVTIVEFADYQCPHCKKAAEVLDKILAEFPNDVALIYKDLPLNSTGVSRAVAEGAFCAQQQGKFWEFHDLAFAQQRQLNHGSAAELAEKLGLDQNAFESCLTSDEAKGHVAASHAEAEENGIDATPAIFINGRRLPLGDLESDLREAVQKRLNTNS